MLEGLRREKFRLPRGEIGLGLSKRPGGGGVSGPASRSLLSKLLIFLVVAMVGEVTTFCRGRFVFTRDKGSATFGGSLMIWFRRGEWKGVTDVSDTLKTRKHLQIPTGQRRSLKERDSKSSLRLSTPFGC